jgi:hypothetical protein
MGDKRTGGSGFHRSSWKFKFAPYRRQLPLLLSLAPDFAASAMATFEAIHAEERFIQKHFALAAVRCVAASFLKIPTRRCGANVSMSAQRLRKHKRPRNVSWQRAIDLAGRIAPHSRCCRSARCAIAVADRVPASVRPRPAGAIEHG